MTEDLSHLPEVGELTNTSIDHKKIIDYIASLESPAIKGESENDANTRLYKHNRERQQTKEITKKLPQEVAALLMPPEQRFAADSKHQAEFRATLQDIRYGRIAIHESNDYVLVAPTRNHEGIFTDIPGTILNNALSDPDKHEILSGPAKGYWAIRTKKS